MLNLIRCNTAVKFNTKDLDFYIIPYLPHLAINRLSEIIDVNTGEKVKQINSNGYYLLYTTMNVYYKVHRLVCETFLIKPPLDHTGLLFVNHKDGNGYNNELSNLEWCTPKENCIHAFETGLRNDNIPVLVKNISTNEIKRYYSISECNRKLGCVLYGSNFSNSTNPPKIYFYNYLIITENENFPDIKKDMIETHEFDNEIYMVRMSTNKVSYKKSIAEASIILNIDKYVLKWKLDKAKKITIMNNWYIIYKSNCNGKDILDIVNEWRNSKKSKPESIRRAVPIIVTDLVTDVKTNWNSCTEFATTLNVGRSALQKYIKKNNNIYKNRYHVEFKPVTNNRYYKI